MKIPKLFCSISISRSASMRVSAANGFVLACLILGLAASQGSRAWAAGGNPGSIASPSSREDSDRPTRNFYSVLEDVLSDFEYDLKNGEVTGLKDIAIRNIAVSENIPPSFKSHLELLITERILKNTRTRVVQCLPCRARRASLNGDKVVITSAESNPTELARIAKLSNISNFMDIAFSYQPSGMVLSMYIIEPEGESIVWSRSYNSETSRAAAFRRGVDYSQTDDARKQTEYVPMIQYRTTVYFLGEPNVANSSGCLGLGLRMMERYDNRKKEVGFEFNYMVDAGSLVNSAQIPVANLYNGLTFNATLLFMHAWNFIGDEENYNKIRGSLALGAGGTYASGYLGSLLRAMWEWRLAKHFSVTAVLGYRPTAGVFVGATSAGTVGGFEYGTGVSLLF